MIRQTKLDIRLRSLERVIAFSSLVGYAVCGRAASITYYPAGGNAPFQWSETANWYATPSAYNVLPSATHGAVPTSADDVLVNAWGIVGVSTPVVIGSGETVTVNNFYLARNASSKPYYGAGASLTVDGGTLNVLGTMYFCPDIYAYGTLLLKNGAVVRVSGEARMGENNYTTAGHCRAEIDATSELDVTGLMTVGRRARCMANIVTNRGVMAVSALTIGPTADVNVGTGIVYNAGCLTVSGDLNVGGVGKGGKGGASDPYYWSRGELVLAEGSTLSLGESSHIYVGGNSANTYGDGILDSSIPIVLAEGQSISIGNANANALHGGVLILRKHARLDNSSSLLDIGNLQYGRAAVKMYDDSSITNVTKIRFGNTEAVDATLEMHDRAMITNVANLRLSETVRSGSKAHILMDGNSAIFFNCTEMVNEGSGLLLGSEPGNEAEIVLGGSAVMTGLYRLNASTIYSGYKVSIKLEGGRIAFTPQDKSSRDSLRLGRAENAADGVASISGYGTFTRLDASAPDSSKYMPLVCRMHDFTFTADGCGEMRDLDMAAFTQFNDAIYGNMSGTNGWYAVNKGRLVYPRATKFVGRRDGNPAVQIGDYHLPGTNTAGEANAPTLVNAFTLEPTTAVTGGRAYCHAALYAPDRTDYPAGEALLKGNGRVVSVWRIGTCAAGWNTSEPQSPWTGWTAMKVTFRFDRTAFDGTRPARLYHHNGTAGGSWHRVATVRTPGQDDLVSATVMPSAGTYDIGWFALVEQSDSGFIVVFR